VGRQTQLAHTAAIAEGRSEADNPMLVASLLLYSTAMPAIAA
jgi:hypothetical protein